MPASTPLYGLRYPQPSDPADVPTDMQNLALDVENALGVIAFGIRNAAVSSSGNAFASGADLLASPLSFTAIAGAWYVVTVISRNVENTVAGNNIMLVLNLDGADGGGVGATNFSTGALTMNGTFRAAFQTTAGSHTLNVRIYTNAGTATVRGGTGGPTANPLPIMVTLERIR